MTLLQVSVLLLLVIVNGPGVDSTCLTDEMARKEANQKYDTLIKRISELTFQSEINNSKMKERLSKIEVEQKERLSKIEVEQKELLHSVLDRLEQQDRYMEESRKERQCDVVRQISYTTWHADMREEKFTNCPKNPYLAEWIVFQRRLSGRLSFNRGWQEYKHGFGDRDEEFWLGLESLHQITSKGKYELRVVITYNGRTEYAQYSSFGIAGESDGYRLSLGPYVGGKAGDSMSLHAGKKFSTPDRDNDQWRSGSCGKKYKSGWWFTSCFNANLNGLWGGQTTWKTVIWSSMGTNSASFTEMKIRPVN